ncbi:concanavalin A-like lectin/glucanase [Polyplosphaeria fusca]|uniref:Concanavalin A-like lectin/glucanase n=1 Tax=Polyplosphaeria fusca TaxID=682080 RepID=A0A9P4QZX3_9PLEO|nr:concanavalin A-like lectin/glucanase [Polyplosphaeria fusca]
MKLLFALSIVLVSAVSATPITHGTTSDIIQRGTPTVRDPSSVQETVSLCTQYAYYAANGYEVLNNLWGKDTATSGSQCTYYEGAVGSGIKWSSTWSWQGAQDNVKSYVYAGRQLTKGNTIAKIKTMPTQINWSYNTTSNVRANVAYDIFTAQDPNHINTTVTIAGYKFDLYFGYNGSMQVFSFVRSGNDLTSFNADVKLFFNYLVTSQQFPESTQNLIVYQIGTEAFTGGPVKFSVSNFSATLST